LQAVPSDANFVLIGRFTDAPAAWQALLDHDVLIRDVGIEGWLRVSAGTPAETTAFLTALAAIAPEHADRERVPAGSASAQPGTAEGSAR
jgi:histidinol-phosphate aminotransferase